MRRGNDLDVYDAWSEQRDCRCVIKALRANRQLHEPARRRLRDEGRLLLGLRHPHIVDAYELIVRPDPLLVLQMLQGETVAHLIAGRRRRLVLTEIVFLGVHLCSAMHYLHGKGFLHLDLKPSNVIAELGQAKVIDFSLARRPGRAKRGVGTRFYLSPEQVRGHPVKAPADAWGIGVVLFEAATGRRAFPNGVKAALGSRDGAGWPPAGPLQRLRRVPRDFAGPISACLDPDPAGRPTVRELSARLRAFAP